MMEASSADKVHGKTDGCFLSAFLQGLCWVLVDSTAIQHDSSSPISVLNTKDVIVAMSESERSFIRIIPVAPNLRINQFETSDEEQTCMALVRRTQITLSRHGKQLTPLNCIPIRKPS
jgi:hypothetical protein